MTGPVVRDGGGPSAEAGGRTPIIRDANGRFLPGHPGLKKGSRIRGPVFLRDALQAEWREQGAESIARLRRERPELYLQVMIGTLPRKWGGKGR